jgi:nucleoside-diphosphate-sugar epimerase
VADLDDNTYLLERHSRYAEDLGRYRRLVDTACNLRRQARSNLANYVLSKLGWSKRATAFRISIARCIESFYATLGSESDRRNAGEFGRDVIEQCCRLAAVADVRRGQVAEPPPSAGVSRTKPESLVLGGTGFIGRELVRQLTAAGRSVRVMTRRGGSVTTAMVGPNLECTRGSISQEADVMRAIEGVRYVFHLARSSARSWQEYYEQDVLAAKRIAACCLRQGVERMIYTSTISCYYAGASGSLITNETPLDPHMHIRDNYSRAKALAEEILLEMHRVQNLPVVIFRPGIVIGTGGSPYHWGVGMWTDGGVCQLWGDGKHQLPFVLVEDVAKGLIRGADADGIEGRTFNLVAEPCLTGLDYVEELQRYAGVELQVFATPIWRFYAADMIKWLAKVMIRFPDRRLPSYHDWKSRSAKAVFDCSETERMLDWQATRSRAEMVARGIHLPVDEQLA